MTISKKLLIATLAFSVLGSVGPTQLVAMKRGADGYPEDERERKRRREEVVQIQIEQIDQEPTREEFLKAIKSKNLELIGNIIEQKPGWMISGPLKYLTEDDAWGLITWFSRDHGRIISQLLNGQNPNLEEVTKTIFGTASSNAFRNSPAAVKSLCTDSRLSFRTVQHLLTDNYYGRSEIVKILLNDSNVNPKALEEAFAFNIDFGCYPLYCCIVKAPDNDVLELLLTSQYVTAANVNNTLKQVSLHLDKIITCINSYPTTKQKNILQLVKAVTFLFADKYGRSGIIERALLVDQLLLEAVNGNNVKAIQLLLCDNRISDEGINSAFVRAVSDRNTQVINLLRVDPRILDASPFPLEDLVDTDHIWYVINYLNGRDRISMKCVNKLSDALL